MSRIRRHMSFANVVSIMALVFAMGGTGYAALKLPKNSVGGAQIKNNAVTGAKVKNSSLGPSDIKNGSLLRDDFKAGQLPAGPAGAAGPAGPAGPGGPSGPDGAAAAFARVSSGGVLDNGTPSQNENIVQANIQHDAVAGATTTGPGVYCIGGLPFTPRSAVVTTDSAGAIGSSNVIASVAVQRGLNLGNCNAGHQQARVSMLAVNDTAAPALTNFGFYIWFEK